MSYKEFSHAISRKQIRHLLLGISLRYCKIHTYGKSMRHHAKFIFIFNGHTIKRNNN